MYDTNDVVDAIAKTEKYADELYAATHELDQSSFDELIEIREKAGNPAQMPGGWTAGAVSQLDTQILCGHGAVVFDTRTNRVADFEATPLRLGMCCHRSLPVPQRSAPHSERAVLAAAVSLAVQDPHLRG